MPSDLPGRLDLAPYVGDTFARVVAVYDDADNRVDFTGCTVLAQVRVSARLARRAADHPRLRVRDL